MPPAGARLKGANVSKQSISMRAVAALEVGVRAQQASTLFCYQAHLLRSAVCAGGVHVPSGEPAPTAAFVVLLGRAAERLVELAAPSAWLDWTSRLRLAVEAEERRWLAADRVGFSWPATPCPAEQAGPLHQLALGWADRLGEVIPNAGAWLRLGMEVCRVQRGEGEARPAWRWARPQRLKELAGQAGVSVRLLFPARVLAHALARAAAVPELFAGWHHVEEGLLRLRGDNAPERNEARASRDFRSAWWFGEEFCFTPDQAACLKTLWEAWENGTPDVGQETVLARSGSKAKRLVDLFKGHQAWGTMIVAGRTKGAFRLRRPAEAAAPCGAAGEPSTGNGNLDLV